MALPVPAGPASEQIVDGHGQIMVRVHEPVPGRDDTVPVRVGVVGKSHGKRVLQGNELGHGRGRGTIHADFAVLVQTHEHEGRVHGRVGHIDIQAVQSGDGLQRDRKSVV